MSIGYSVCALATALAVGSSECFAFHLCVLLSLLTANELVHEIGVVRDAHGY